MTDWDSQGVASEAREVDRKITGPSSRRVWIVLAVAISLLGLFLRIWALGRSPIDSDIAVVGLMAHEILHGHFSAFFWGQKYGGAEPYFVAAVFAVCGQSAFVLGICPVILDAIAAILIWRIGSRLFTPAIGATAALLFWIWPEVDLQLSIIEFGFRWCALVCGLASLLTALRIADGLGGEPTRSRYFDWTALGLSLGIGWWASPEILYYAIPALGVAVAALIRNRSTPVIGSLLTVAGTGIGALPWFWDNVGHGFASLRVHGGPGRGFGVHLEHLGSIVVPMLLGLRLRLSGAWIVPPLLGWSLYTLILIVAVTFLALLVVQRRTLALVIFCVLAPFEYSIAPTNYSDDARYGFYFSPVISLVLVAALFQMPSLSAYVRARSKAELDRVHAGWQTVGIALFIGLALTIVAAVRVTPFRQDTLVQSERAWSSWQTDPTSIWFSPVIESLQELRINDVYASYWIGEVLSFESGARITTTDVPSIRYQPFANAVESAKSAIWLFTGSSDSSFARAEQSGGLFNPLCLDSRRRCLTPSFFEAYLDSIHNPYRAITVGSFIEVLPNRPVEVSALLARVPRTRS